MSYSTSITKNDLDEDSLDIEPSLYENEIDIDDEISSLNSYSVPASSSPSVSSSSSPYSFPLVTNPITFPSTPTVQQQRSKVPSFIPDLVKELSKEPTTSTSPFYFTKNDKVYLPYAPLFPKFGKRN